MEKIKYFLITCAECKHQWVQDDAPCGDIGNGKNLLGEKADGCPNCGKICGGSVTYIDFIRKKKIGRTKIKWW